MLERNVTAIEKSISQSCHSADRSRDEVRLVAVTKSVDSAQVRALVDLGLRDFGENRAEELLAKQAALPSPDLVWHFIGRLQRRKVKEVINRIDYFHALDNVRLAGEIQKRAERPLKCFVQVNVSQETSKQGLALAETTDFIKSLAAFDQIQVVGLMTMAPYDGEPAFIESCFQALTQKRDEIVALGLAHAPCRELSMGMTQDYPSAIKAGATVIRIGTAFFKN